MFRARQYGVVRYYPYARFAGVISASADVNASAIYSLPFSRRPVPRAACHRLPSTALSVRADAGRLAVPSRDGDDPRVLVLDRLKDGLGRSPEIVVRRIVMRRYEHARPVGVHVFQSLRNDEGRDVGR